MHVENVAMLLKPAGPVPNLLKLLDLNIGGVRLLQVVHELLVGQHIMSLEPNREAREELIDQFMGVSHRKKSGGYM